MVADMHYETKDSLFIIKASGFWRMRSWSAEDASMLAHVEEEILDTMQNDIYARVCFEYTQPSVSGNEKTQVWDSFLLSTFAFFMHQAKEMGKAVDYSSLPADMQKLLSVQLKSSQKANLVAETSLQKIGASVLRFPKKFEESVNFLGEVMATFPVFFRGKASCTSRDVWQEIYNCGVSSLPIISLVSILLGLILAFVSALQFRLLASEIYSSAFVSISMVRVMGPVVTAIVIAGKIGASYAATIGTMKVNEEVDALETFGIPPLEFLVLPRVFALVIMLPFLTMYANFMGILGGFLVMLLWLDISPIAFLENVRSLAAMHYLWVGLLHSFIFGFVISLSSCFQGMKSGNNAEAVGIATTKAVVNSIVGIVVTTAIITLVFSFVGM